MKLLLCQLLCWFIVSSSFVVPQNRGFRPSEQDQSERRVALVIGNAKYASAPLRNPENDAKDIATTLRELNFQVLSFANLSAREMENAIMSFGEKLTTNTIALFYYSGHAIQVGGKNYLLPVNANINKEQDVKFEAVDADRAIGEMENARSRMNIVILDACRDNPLPRSYRGTSRGLTTIEAPVGTIIAYSTSPGKVASDGDGRNGLYSEQLIKFIRSPGLKIEDVFKRVRAEVLRKSNGAQTPWENSSITGDFYFSDSSNTLTKTSTTARTSKWDKYRRPLPSISNSIGMEFVLVQPGTFQMGSNDVDEHEKPSHTVTISKPYYIGKYEVTQKQWRDVMGTNPSKIQGENRPVETVSWYDVQEFIRKLNEKEGSTKHRLPTEAEWEFAARGGTRSKGYTYSGGNNSDSVAWCLSNSVSDTHPVGTKGANELGLYDMSGNVWEWCWDCYEAYSASAQTDPKGPSSMGFRVLRGGSYNNNVINCRVAYRLYSDPLDRGDRDFRYGFRCVRDVE